MLAYCFNCRYPELVDWERIERENESNFLLATVKTEATFVAVLMVKRALIRSGRAKTLKLCNQYLDGWWGNDHLHVEVIESWFSYTYSFAKYRVMVIDPVDIEAVSREVRAVKAELKSQAPRWTAAKVYTL